MSPLDNEWATKEHFHRMIIYSCRKNAGDRFIMITARSSLRVDGRLSRLLKHRLKKETKKKKWGKHVLMRRKETHRWAKKKVIMLLVHHYVVFKEEHKGSQYMYKQSLRAGVAKVDDLQPCHFATALEAACWWHHIRAHHTISIHTYRMY